ncbi:hypothetical protein BH24ACT2_BH24ACT2_16120 [soil metagenome]
MSPADLDAAVTALLQRTRAAQNLPEKFTDPATLARVVALLDPERDSTPAAGPGRCKDSHRPASLEEVVCDL